MTSKDMLVGFVHRRKRRELGVGICILRIVEVVKVGTDDRADVFEVGIGGEHGIVKVVVGLVHSFRDEVNAVSCIVLQGVNAVVECSNILFIGLSFENES